jgi:hypothetical protein
MTIARHSVHYLFGYDLDCESEGEYSPVYLVWVITGDEINPLLGNYYFWFFMPCNCPHICNHLQAWSPLLYQSSISVQQSGAELYDFKMANRNFPAVDKFSFQIRFAIIHSSLFFFSPNLLYIVLKDIGYIFCSHSTLNKRKWTLFLVCIAFLMKKIGI